ncbi:AraC family transcriptional regulator [Xanthobacter pseudotagetidis]|uniref:AraC family transcriptional regulator n=1 Tax=Xanthobacter pseudotagetidis TaxID=3119911 RepID=UPI003726A21E
MTRRIRFGEVQQANTVENAPVPVVGVSRDDRQGHVIAFQQHRRCQLLFAAEGVMRVRSPEGMWIIPPLRALWIPSGMLHEVTMLTPVSMRTIYVSPEAAQDEGGRCRLIEVGRLLRELMLALMDEPVDYAPGDRGDSIARLIISEIARAPLVPVEIPWPGDRRLLRICEAILANPADNRSLDDWADEVGASTRTLIRLFASETGLHFRHWVHQVQISEALCRLARGVPIGEIARELGYSSPSAFANMFRTVMGVSPSHYLGIADAGRRPIGETSAAMGRGA